MATYSLNGTAGTLVVAGKGLTLDMVEALREGSVEWSTGSVSEVKVSLEDRRRAILNSGMVDPGRADGAVPGSPLSVGGHPFEVRAIEHAEDGTLVIQARSALVAKMKRVRGVQVTKGPISPSQWISRAVTKSGGKCIGQGSSKRQQITRQKDESDWDTAMRLAREEGFLCYETDGTVVIGKPSWLIARPGTTPWLLEIVNDPAGIARPTDPQILTRPAPRRSSDSTEVCEWQITLTADLAATLTIGWPIKLTGYPPFNGTYLIDKLTLPLDDNGVATLHATTPVDPEKQAQAGTATAKTATSSVSSSSKTVVAAARAGRYGGVNLNAQQMANAATIIKVGIAMGIPTKGLIVAIATAMQESTLKNLTYGDRDSIGLFQQRPSQGWGTRAQIMDPQYSARKFFTTLLQVSGWQSLAVTVAAQRVQRSAYPNAYAKWVSMATAVVAATVRTVVTSTSTAATKTSGSSTRVDKVIAAARAQLGKPYIWGGTGPRGYDCSGLVQMAWRAGGFSLPRTTYTMLADRRLKSVSRSSLRPGDLVFPNSGHVMLYIGGGRVVEARKTGTPILEGSMWGFGQARRIP